ncbi:hypothetical protein Y032_0228g2869 [Ancylostoma ceylanicum]|uniref:Uncharacterized protein n=1 Tax=Ancylostoma ceylanicum TaxID=53326 RepID=A0A016SHE0_9BILA|nr:hypothetical protein Y032_0228g2869 [Ancylostoma ceylanicum]
MTVVVSIENIPKIAYKRYIVVPHWKIDGFCDCRIADQGYRGYASTERTLNVPQQFSRRYAMKPHAQSVYFSDEDYTCRVLVCVIIVYMNLYNFITKIHHPQYYVGQVFVIRRCKYYT